MKKKRKYLVSYNIDVDGKNGFGSGVTTLTFRSWRNYFRGYNEKDMHKTRKLLAESARRQFKIGTNKRVQIVILNIVTLPIK